MYFSNAKEKNYCTFKEIVNIGEEKMLKIERETDHIKSIKYRQNNESGKLCAEMVYYINGKRYSKHFSGKTKEIIEEKIEQFKADLFNNELILLSPDLSFEKFTLSWLNNIKKHKVKQGSLMK